MPAKSQLIAILNVTPDSFYPESRCETVEKAITEGLRLWREGADILDIGGESTRPGARELSEDQEKERILPVIRALKKEITIPISIDTRHCGVAEAALEAGADLINDVSGFREERMRLLAAKSGASIIVMHMLGTPQTMQSNPFYPKGIVAELIDFFSMRTEQLQENGVQKRQIILDPGIGFGKTVEDNLEILRKIPQFKTLGFPLLIGISRKSFMSNILNKPSHELLPATIAMNTVCLMSHVEFIRVHDVSEHRATINLINRYLER